MWCAACGRIGFDPAASTSPDAPPAVLASFEAESGLLTPSFAIALDVAASGGRYLVDGNSEGLGGPGAALYHFTVPTLQTYFVWGRSLAPTTSRDSFFVAVDGAADREYETTDCSYDGLWRWVAVRESFTCAGGLGALFGIPLGAGDHTLRLRSREGQSALDRFVITDDPAFVPVD